MVQLIISEKHMVSKKSIKWVFARAEHSQQFMPHLYPEKLNSLTVYVAPFDFTTDKCMLYKWTKYLDVDTMVDSLGIIPADLLNAGFGMLKPSGDISKYFGVLDNLGDDDKIMNFLRMEFWKNDCPDLAGEMYQ